jgi:hypothetical protein
MISIVVKPFATPSHRFVVGQVVNESDVDGPLDVMALIGRGFLLPGTVMPEPEPEPPTEPPAPTDDDKGE